MQRRVLVCKVAIRAVRRTEFARGGVNPPQRVFDPLDRLVDPAPVHLQLLLNLRWMGKALPRAVDKSL